jgi:hypothetical protein
MGLADKFRNQLLKKVSDELKLAVTVGAKEVSAQQDLQKVADTFKRQIDGRSSYLVLLIKI